MTSAVSKPSASAWTGEPSFADVLAARDFLAAHLAPTPLVRREAVNRALGLDIWLKCESLLPTAAFKVRGGLNLIGRDPTAKAGVIGASTGNHGQSLSYAGGVFDVPVTIVVPKGANPLKVAAMRANGATIVEHGSDYDDARAECERRAAASGTRYVHSGNEPYLIAGVATAALEVLTERPDTDVFIVPVGGGSGASGAALVAKTLRPKMTVIGVQAEGAPAAYNTWRDRAPRSTERAATFRRAVRRDAPAADRRTHRRGRRGGRPDRRRAPHGRASLRQARGVLGQWGQRDSGLTAARAGSTLIDPSRAFCAIPSRG